MVVLAATWRERPQEEHFVNAYSGLREFFCFFGPSIPVLLIVLMSILLPQGHAWTAMSALLLSFVAFAFRLGVTQYGQRIGEQALRGSLSLLEATLESTADGILVVNRNGEIVSFNRRFVELWRIPKSLVNTSEDARMLDYVVKQLKDPEAFLSKVRELYSKPHEEGYDILQFKDSRVFERYSKPQYVEGEAVGRVWSFRDITQRWFLESQLRHSQKLEAVGRLAGGVAHDFNNVLTVMSGYLQLALNNKKTEQAVARDLLEVQKAVNHASSLTKQLLAFSRQQVLRPEVLELNECITSLLQILRRVISEDIEITTRLAPELGSVLIDRTQLEQVIMNLAVNARDAMPEGGSLSFETRNVSLDCKYCEGLPDCAPGNYSVLTIRDTGAGMEPQTMAHIFEPFFTTKDPGKGTGLGLSTVYGIVKQTGGFIDVKSKVGAGTTFSVYFPQVESVVQPLKPKQSSTANFRGTETILIVEDNQELRHLTSKILASNGYKVLEADGGSQAEMICENYPGKIDLVLSDVVMPGLRGPEVVKRLISMRPTLRAIFISGFTDDGPFAESVLSEKTEFLQKPFDPPALLAKVREVLDAPTAGTSQKVSA
jgi:signal transduction histidine kinase/ActR/RegA family two-component response regulator